jgi:hypothetical protein
MGELFGFAGVVAFLLLIAFIGFGWRISTVWAKSQDRKVDAEIKRNDELATAQKVSYDRHVEFGQNTQEVMQKMSASTESIGRAIELMATTSRGDQKVLDSVHAKTDRIHRAAKQAILVVADMMSDQPGIKEKLREIAREMESPQ